MPESMIAIPADASPPGSEHLTGMSCPECPGTLFVRRPMADTLTFTCRIGHTYTLAELVMAKERSCEEFLWAAVCALEELHALLHDARVDPERARRALAEAALVRAVIEKSVPARIEVP